MSSKRFRGLRKLIEQGRLYGVDEAISLAKKCANAKFDETIELSINLGIDPKRTDQQVRSTVILPQGTGRNVRVIVFAKGEKAKEAKEAGCEIVGDEDLIEKVKGGFLAFDVAIATPDMMGSLAKLGKILGPRGLMPNPKTGTVTMEVGKAVREFKKGKIEYRADAYGIVHVAIGKASFDLERIRENFSVILSSILKAKPSGLKGQYLKGIHLSTTMGPGISVNPEEAKRSIAE